MLNPLTRAQVDFELREEIGAEGKNSSTFKAFDPQLGAEIVVKSVSKSDLSDENAFFSEARSLYATAHPYVVQLHYACCDDACVYLAMPYYKKGSLKGLIEKRALTVREIVRFGCQILTGLHNVHSKGLIHFDIKADNVLISDRNEALISDFGLARPTVDGTAEQTRVYAPIVPPEALAVTSFDARYDIYQFGLLLYSMCVGQTAYKANFLQYEGGDGAVDAEKFIADIKAGKFPDRKSLPPHLPSRLKSLIKKCLQVDPADRHQSALEVMNDLAQVSGNELDWQYVVVGSDRVWTKKADGTEYVFTVSANCSTKLTKAVNGGPARNQKVGEMHNAREADISRILKAH